MLVVCIDSTIGKYGKGIGLTKGNKYEVVKITYDAMTNNKFFTIKQDSNIIAVYYANRFKPLSEIRLNKLKKIC